MELCITNVTKQFKEKVAVNDVTLTLKPGVIGLLGANGAGKTTLMKTVCGVLKPTAGTITYNGLDSSEAAYRDRLGYLPQDFSYYPNFTAKQYLTFMAALKGLDSEEAKKKIPALLKTVNLEDVQNKKIKTFSGGMKQRLGIAQAVLNNPSILVLDEPTAGLDPKERVRFRNLIAELGKDSIVILSTHIVSDVEQIADRILMYRDGSVVFDGTVADLDGNLEQAYLTYFEGVE